MTEGEFLGLISVSQRPESSPKGHQHQRLKSKVENKIYRPMLIFQFRPHYSRNYGNYV